MANAAPCAAADAQTPITQIDFARAGVVTPQMAAVAAAEGREPEDIRAAVATGRIAIPANIHHASLAPAPSSRAPRLPPRAPAPCAARCAP